MFQSIFESTRFILACSYTTYSLLRSDVKVTRQYVRMCIRIELMLL